MVIATEKKIQNGIDQLNHYKNKKQPKDLTEHAYLLLAIQPCKLI